MPKTATRQKSSTTTNRDSNNGSSKTASPKPDDGSPQATDKVDRKEAQAEYKERKKSQKDSIKNTDPKLLKEMLYQMVLGRVFEQKCAEVYRIGKIGGFCHLYIGQEAVGVGAIMATDRDRDFVITAYRDHVQAMVVGITPEAVMAELYGKAGGNVGGKGGSMHMFSKEFNFFGGHGIVGGQIGVGTGMAYAQKYKESDGVTLCFFGEAAVNQGIFHESLNMAQLWKLPIIYICENNQYGMGTSQKRAMSISSIASKAEGFGMANEFVDGMDVMAVREATERAVKRARKNSLPTLLEIRCYRYMGHSMSDPGKYRTTEEIKKYQERDPIVLFKESLTEAKVISDKDYTEIEIRAKESTEKAMKFADESPLPDAKELFTDVYA
ncbi:MAG: pyruvate dehydrogenase (acetyl-transferring) E1 component subunit alpha [Acidobacteria bacterium]|nr:pyruvate dehydrogenase (acetyl-transferring) E1 component subunit alpha [Acidobacteriota bacterium]MCA1640056.1 pyruvate dehydrogenase (acetyl-transferring) E1 component subunit alpha [Acidobacteriota bacterium]